MNQPVPRLDQHFDSVGEVRRGVQDLLELPAGGQQTDHPPEELKLLSRQPPVTDT
jgi:hypothetical protein